jgi:hypothetical protein
VFWRIDAKSFVAVSLHFRARTRSKINTYSFPEAISLVQSLISQSPNIQKILAFEGAFERLFKIITQEEGMEGGVVAQGALRCVEGLLRHNPSNQVRDRREKLLKSEYIYYPELLR